MRSLSSWKAFPVLLCIIMLELSKSLHRNRLTIAYRRERAKEETMSGRVMLTLIAAVAMLAAACNNAPPTGGPGPSAATGGTLRIGFTSSQTGSLNKESKEQTQGLQLWANDVNGQGGIAVGDQHYQVQLVSYDDESVQDRVQQLYTRLITDDKVDFLISPYGSASAAASMVV